MYSSRYFPEKIQPAIDRYQNEVKRLFTVVDTHLADNEYLVDEYSIADIANWCWIRSHEWSGVEIDDLPNLKRWKSLIDARPAARKGVDVPMPVDREKLLESGEERCNSLATQNIAPTTMLSGCRSRTCSRMLFKRQKTLLLYVVNAPTTINTSWYQSKLLAETWYAE